MDAVGRLATIEAASASLSTDSVLSALIEEVKALKSVVGSAAFPSMFKLASGPRDDIKALLPKALRKELWLSFRSMGGTSVQWAKIVRRPVSRDQFEEMARWDRGSWHDYIGMLAVELDQNNPEHKTADNEASEALLESIRAEVPAQPWPKGTGQIVRTKFGISWTTWNRAVRELVRRGQLRYQIDGELFEPPTEPAANAPSLRANAEPGS